MRRIDEHPGLPLQGGLQFGTLGEHGGNAAVGHGLRGFGHGLEMHDVVAQTAVEHRQQEGVGQRSGLDTDFLAGEHLQRHGCRA
ncbi:hypothetical protein SDC9_194710 [bioreactor metagenome]|uniref:Uncharacterized protein n=1 Tax=bioreactor metagenome TaxID=1076179 RepID=A0A645I7L6_9ZZZZ